jgi:hypothetical protein
MPIGDTTQNTTILFHEMEGILIRPCHGNHINLTPLWQHTLPTEFCDSVYCSHQIHAQLRCCLLDGSSNVE